MSGGGTDPRLRGLADYFRLMNLNGASHAYREASRVGLLEALGGRPSKSAELARGLTLAERPVALLLRVLETLGVVAREGERYTLTLMGRALQAGSYRNLSDEYWAHLPDLLRTGEPFKRMDDPAAREAQYAAQAAALGWMLGPAAEAAATVLEAEGRRRLAILDVGAGSAVWSLALASRAPETRIVAVDWPAVLRIAAAAAEAKGLRDRLKLLPGDYHAVALPPASFDLALAGNVTHLETPEGNAALFRRLHATLKPGGEVAILDVFPGQPEGDLNRTLYELGLALRTGHGRVYTPEELTAFLEAAGFCKTRSVPLPVPPYAVGMLVTAKD